jgi:L-rhamnose mutarotase
MKRYCLALDLKDDPELIAAYEVHHEHVWPEVIENIKTAGIERMEIYRVSNRLFMIMEVNDSFTFMRKGLLDLASTKVQQWELLMWKYQQKLPFAKPGEKWMLMEKIFSL